MNEQETIRRLHAADRAVAEAQHLLHGSDELRPDLLSIRTRIRNAIRSLESR